MPLHTRSDIPNRSPLDQAALQAIAQAAQPLTGAPREFDDLAAQMGAARFALMGEATHGSHEFHEARAAITRRMVESHGVNAIAVEADWTDAWRVNCYVRGLPAIPGGRADTHGAAALEGFARFPAWLWRNTVLLEFIEWLRAYNEGLPPDERVGFYGMDLYSLFASIDIVLHALDQADPAAATRVRARYAGFDHLREDTQAFAYATHFDMAPGLEDAVVAQLMARLRNHGRQLAEAVAAVVAVGALPRDDVDAGFNAGQHARVLPGAEAYYRGMFGPRIAAWNLRERHMAETLDALDVHLQTRRDGRAPKFAVWAHSMHLGDARATAMGLEGERSLGQLLRQRHGRDVFVLGFSTYTGAVTAASGWGAPARAERLRPGLPDSVEGLLHETLFHTSGAPGLVLPLCDQPGLSGALAEPRLQRAIGVVYAPHTERQSHYFDTRLPDQFDVLVHIDTTHALEPLASAPLGARWA